MTKVAKSIFAVAMVLTIVTAAVAFSLIPYGSESTETAVLKKGMTGSQVRTMQTKLKNWGYYSGNIDGIFGTQTYNAVIYFQKVNKLQVDGIVGAETAAALGMTLTGSTSSNSSYSSSDLYLLAKCVYAEARGEPYTGQVAIAAVVLNRVKHSSFPNTIAGVIYQPGAFTAVTDGQINLEPNSTAYSAARDALNGWDPTNGCIYYYNPATATSSWIWSRTVKLSIGNHNFAV